MEFTKNDMAHYMRNRTAIVFAPICLALVLTAGFAGVNAVAQVSIQERFSAALERAESYLNHGQHEEALLLLEKLDRDHPGEQEVHRLLRRAYERSKNYGKLLDLLLAGLPSSDRYAEDVGLIADCWFKLEQVDAAESTLTALLTPLPAAEDYFDQAARAYLRNGRYQQAVAIYETARTHFGQPRLFSRQLADLYESRREYAKAIMEYFWDLQENPRSLKVVQNKIAAIVRMEEGTTELTAALQEIVAAHPENFHAHRLYAELLIEQGDPEAAWPEYLAADDLSENPSEDILYFIMRCLQDGHYAAAQRACGTFLHRYPDHQRGMDVRIYSARALAGLQQPDSAVAILRGIAAAFPNLPLKAELYLEIGAMYLDELHEPDSAETFFRDAVSLSANREYLFGAAVRLADCMLLRNDLAAADSIYESCERIRLREDQQEIILFKRAEVLFFAEAFDSAKQVLDGLMRRFPDGFYVNDAIILGLRIEENREPLDWSLKRFATAAFLEKRRQFDSARLLLWELARDSANSLADDALYELGKLYTELDRPDSAAISYGILTERYPDGFLMPAALTAQGTVYADKLRQPAAAREAYRRVLTEYADSPYLEEARRRLQGLEAPPVEPN
jgi:tetratricopeptide (TPR) repeat protein